jgi:hypothetical protein
MLRPETLEELIDIAFVVWEVVDESEAAYLIDSMPRRLQAVIDRNGDRTEY